MKKLLLATIAFMAVACKPTVSTPVQTEDELTVDTVVVVEEVVDTTIVE